MCLTVNELVTKLAENGLCAFEATLLFIEPEILTR